MRSVLASTRSRSCARRSSVMSVPEQIRYTSFLAAAAVHELIAEQEQPFALDRFTQRSTS